MIEHENLKKLTEGNEKLMQEAIKDYLSANPKCFLTGVQYKLEQTVEKLFDYLDYANGPECSDIKNFKGDSCQPGMVTNFINAFKTLFINSRDANGKIDMDNIPRGDLFKAYNNLHSGMESFGLLVALKNFFFQKKNMPKEYTLGTYARDITAKLMERVFFSDENSMILLKTAITSVQIYRNKKDHQNADQSYMWSHIYEMMMFMCVSVHIGYLLSCARFGGVRYDVRERGVLTFFCNGKQISKNTGVSEFTNRQFTPIYQFNLPARWQPEFDCRIEFRSLDGRLLDTRRFDVRGTNFCTFKYQPVKKEEDKVRGEVRKQSLDIPKVQTTVIDKKLTGIPFLEGTYIGPVDSEGLPEGKGIYVVDNLKYDGNFEHGKPFGEFTIRFEDPTQKFIYRGTVSPELLPVKGYIKYLSEDKTFEGDFDGWAIVKGKKIKSGRLAYEGDFQVINDETGQGYNLYHGHGKLYDDEFVYEGEFSCGQIDGEGVMTYTDGKRSPVRGIWSQGDLIYDFSGQSNTIDNSDDRNISNGDLLSPNSQNIEGSKTVNEAPERRQTVSLLLLLPEEEPLITDNEGNRYEVDPDNPILEVPSGVELTAVLPSDERAVVRYQTSQESSTLEQWDIDELMNKVKAELPAVVGTGSLTLDDGSEYEGEWNIDKQPHGNGVLKTPDSNVYSGEFAYGKFHGKGELKMKRQTYVGEFKEGVYHGYGVTIQSNGDKLEGNYMNGLKDGRFVLTTSRGMVRVTIWSMGELIS